MTPEDTEDVEGPPDFRRDRTVVPAGGLVGQLCPEGPTPVGGRE